MAAAGAKWKNGKVRTAKQVKVASDRKYNKMMLTRAQTKSRMQTARKALGLPANSNTFGAAA